MTVPRMIVTKPNTLRASINLKTNKATVKQTKARGPRTAGVKKPVKKVPAKKAPKKRIAPTMMTAPAKKRIAPTMTSRPTGGLGGADFKAGKHTWKRSPDSVQVTVQIEQRPRVSSVTSRLSSVQKTPEDKVTGPVAEIEQRAKKAASRSAVKKAAAANRKKFAVKPKKKKRMWGPIE